MEPLFTKEQLNNMNREDLVKVTLLMQEQKSKNENEIQLLKDKQKGADASAITYSIVETALLNGLKPYLYLTYVLESLRQLGPFPKPEELDRLLPWSEDLPEEIKTKTKSKK